MMQNYFWLGMLGSTLSLFGSLTHAEQLSAEQKFEVQQIIQVFKTKNTDRISQHIDYPLIRQQPIPAIKNATDMKLRFKQVFDDKLLTRIAKSTPSQWSSVGWRGVMFENGEVWLNDNKISAVNMSNTTEKNLKKQLIAKQKSQLHSSLKTFKQPEVLFKTTQYLIRVDQLNNGNYRYASWKLGQSQASKPDLIINNGKLDYDGSGGNHAFNFSSGNYHYQVYRMLMGSDESSEVSLNVQKGTKTVLEQDGRLINW